MIVIDSTAAGDTSKASAYVVHKPDHDGPDTALGSSLSTCVYEVLQVADAAKSAAFARFAMPILSELKRRQAKTVREKWWEKGPTLPGEGCTPAQRRLADDKAHYTGVCRLLQATSLSRVGTHTSDFCTRPPLEASKLLLNRRYEELNIPRR
ncbi:unnamed protein product, partial [Symbiodinium sp. KB8]